MVRILNKDMTRAVRGGQPQPNAIGLETGGDAIGLEAGSEASAGAERSSGLGGVSGVPAAGGVDTSEADAFLRGLNDEAQEPSSTGETYGYEMPKFERNDSPDGGAMQYLYDMYGDTESDKKATRAHQARLAIMGIGDAFRHLGNIYHASKGAPAQKLSASVPAEDVRYQKKALAEQERRRKQAEFSYKVAKERADRSDKDRNYRLSWTKAANEVAAKRNSEKRAREDAARKDRADKRAEELQPWRVKKAQSDAETAATRAKYEETNQKLKQENIKSAMAARANNTKLGWARLELQRKREARMAANGGRTKKNKKSGGGKSDVRLLVNGNGHKGELTGGKLTGDDWTYIFDSIREAGGELPYAGNARQMKEAVMREIRNGSDAGGMAIDILTEDYGYDYDDDLGGATDDGGFDDPIVRMVKSSYAETSKAHSGR